MGQYLLNSVAGDYDMFIRSIIESRGQWAVPEDGYFEGHHIIPRCMGGKGCTRCKHANIIRLTPEEHFIAHKLLVDKYPQNTALKRAFACMCFVLGDKRKKRLSIDAETYAQIKRDARQIFSWYTNGVEEARGVDCPAGWHPGRSDRMREIVHNQKHTGSPGPRNGMYGKKHSFESKMRRHEKSAGRRWYNNGETEIYIDKRVAPPPTFTPGRLQRNWYTNGQQNVFCRLCPEGFACGKTRHLNSSAPKYVTLYKIVEGKRVRKPVAENSVSYYLEEGWTLPAGVNEKK